MGRQSRVTAAVVVTLLVVVVMAVYAYIRLRIWDETGIAGFTYMQVTPGVKKQPTFMGIGPGMVMITYPDGPADRAGIRARDVIVTVNGIPIANVAELREIDARLKTGDAVTYRIRNAKGEREVRLRLASPLQNPLLGSSIILCVIVAAAYIAIGLFVFTRKPDDRRVAVFYALVIVAAISLFSTPVLSLEAGNIRGVVSDPQRSLLPFVAFLVAAMAVTPLTLHLALVFPRERPILQTSPRLLRWVYGIPVMGVIWLFAFAAVPQLLPSEGRDPKRLLQPINIGLAIITLAGLVVALRVARHARTVGLRKAFWDRPIQSMFVFTATLLGIARVADALEWKWVTAIAAGLNAGAPFLVLLLFPILTCIALYRSYRDAGVEERRQVKWPLWGTLIAILTKIVVGFVSQVGVFWLMATERDLGAWMDAVQVCQFIPTIASLLIPISFAFAILKYRLMNIDVIIRKTVAYTFLTGAILVLYLLLVGGLGTVLVNVAGMHNQTMVIASTLVVALLFVPLRNRLQTLVDRNLFRHKYEYPDALKAMSAETLTATDLGSFLASSAEKIQQALQNRAVVVFVTRHEELVAAAKVGVSDSLVGTVRMSRAPFVPLLDRPFDPTRRALPEDAAAALKRLDTTLVVPINTPATPANGFIALAPKLSNAPFDVEDIDFLRSAADQLDVGIDRIRQQREGVDFEQARAIQQSLLPQEMPHVAGIELSGTWQPARTMGGDYYDVLKLSDNALAICIGDVAGKGMPAALLMSGLQAAVRATAGDSPRDLCERVRRVVVSSLAGGRFVTFFYATIDTAAMRLRWCNAGHNAPIVARADGSIVRLSEGGPAFSRLFKDDRYEEREMAIAAGDRIVLFTDGVSEAAGEGGEIFGEQRLEELVADSQQLSADELQAAIVDAATAFTGGELEDDLTLVVAALTMPA